jgi:hypothetical protein
MKRLLLVLALMFGASLVAIQPVNAGEWCADGTWSNSSGKGTCSWHGGIQGNTTKKKTNSYNDPWGTTTNNDPFGTTKKKTGGYCSSFDRSYGRC